MTAAYICPHCKAINEFHAKDCIVCKRDLSVMRTYERLNKTFNNQKPKESKHGNP